MTALLSGNELPYLQKSLLKVRLSNLVSDPIESFQKFPFKKLKSSRRSLLMQAGPHDMRKHGAQDTRETSFFWITFTTPNVQLLKTLQEL